MVCTYCRKKTRVTNSRSSAKNNLVWRRRACPSCQAVFTTFESVDLENTISVVKRDGAIEPFLRDKLFLAVFDACSHRKAARNDATAVTATIIASILAKKTAALKNVELVELVYEILHRFDKLAATVYRAKYVS
jgi:transcriptional repressor NrdR